jgi:excisionase family DNA binding protein
MTIGTIEDHGSETRGSALEAWMTTKEVAQYLRCSSKTVLRLHLPCAQFGRLRRYRREDVVTFLDRRVS